MLFRSATRASVDPPLDGPLWVTAKGAYLDPTDHDHAVLKADLGGWKDMNLSDKLPGGQSSLPLDVGSLARQLAPAPSPAPASSKQAPLSASAGSLSASGISVQSQMPSKGLPASVGPADLAHSSLSGQVGLKTGKADLGSVKADLLKEDAKDNTLGVEAKGPNLALEFTRLLVGSFSTSLGGTNVQAGKAAVGDGTLKVQDGGGSRNVNGKIGSVKVENLDVGR